MISIPAAATLCWREFIGLGRSLGRGRWAEILLALVVELPYSILVFSSPFNVWDAGGLQSLYERVNNKWLSLPFLAAALLTIVGFVISYPQQTRHEICYCRFAGGFLSFMIWGWMSFNIMIEGRGNLTSLMFYIQSALIGMRSMVLACQRR